jgi:hypothetical protein
MILLTIMIASYAMNAIITLDHARDTGHSPKRVRLSAGATGASEGVKRMT